MLFEVCGHVKELVRGYLLRNGVLERTVLTRVLCEPKGGSFALQWCHLPPKKSRRQDTKSPEICVGELLLAAGNLRGPEQLAFLAACGRGMLFSHRHSLRNKRTLVLGGPGGGFMSCKRVGGSSKGGRIEGETDLEKLSAGR